MGKIESCLQVWYVDFLGQTTGVGVTEWLANDLGPVLHFCWLKIWVHL